MYQSQDSFPAAALPYTYSWVRLPDYEDEYTRLGLTRPIGADEVELVSVIASAIFAGDHPDSAVRVKRITALDEEKIAAVAAVSAFAASDHPDSMLQLVRITQVK